MNDDTRAVVRALAAGSVAGIASTVVVHPMDTIRTRLQTNPIYKGAWDCFKQTTSKEGYRALYKGMLSPVLAQGIYKSVMFGGYEFAKKGVERLHRSAPAAAVAGSKVQPAAKLSYLEMYVCGAFAGGMNSFVVTPVELARNRLMVQGSQSAQAASTAAAAGGAAGSASAPKLYRGPLDVLRTVVKTEGFRGLWRGQTATLCRDLPGVGGFYAANEFAKTYLAANHADLPLFVRMMLAGGAAGFAFWSVALPFDGIKSVIQTQGRAAAGADGKVSVPKLVADKIKKDGVFSLYRGWTVAFFRGIPAAAITFTTFGYAQRLLSQV